MKCMSKRAYKNKCALEDARRREAEKIRWNSLTPEQQEAELAERKKKDEAVRQSLKNLATLMSYCNGPYGKF